MRERKKERKKERKEHTPESVIMERTGFPRKDLVIEFSALDIAIGFLLVPFFLCACLPVFFFLLSNRNGPQTRRREDGKHWKKERKKERKTNDKENHNYRVCI